MFVLKSLTALAQSKIANRKIPCGSRYAYILYCQYVSYHLIVMLSTWYSSAIKFLSYLKVKTGVLKDAVFSLGHIKDMHLSYHLHPALAPDM